MIYCVDHSDVVAHLHREGFRTIGETEITTVLARGTDIVAIRKPNVDGHVPEILILDAFDIARLPPPALPVFWCD